VLQAGIGSWRGRIVSYSFQWKRCNGRGGNCEAVGGATGSFYPVGDGDTAHTLRVSVTARNGYGSTTATSKPKRVGRLTTGSSASGSADFDGRAKSLTTLYSYLDVPGDPTTKRQGQDPHIWDCLCFIDNSISLVSDSRYGKVYKAAEGPGDKSPWGGGLGAWQSAGQLSIRQPNDLGKWDYYGIAVRIDSWADMVGLNNVTLASFGYQTSSGDQVALGLMNTSGGFSFEIHQNSGYASGTSGWVPGAVSYKQAFLPVPFGKWQDFVIAIKWATDNTGGVEVYTRNPAQTSSWSKVFSKLNEPTYLYGTTTYGTFAKDGSNWPTVLDKIGLYYGYGDHSKTSFPTETVYETGLTRSSDLATAKSTLH
jgi:hypothetical protein